MTEYFEASQRHSSDARMVARVINPRGPYLYERFHDPSPITDGPEISWSWDAPAPLVDWCRPQTRARLQPADHRDRA